MKNITRILALLLVLCTVFSLCACGTGKNNEDTTKAEETTKADKETKEEDTTEDTTAEDTTEADTTEEETAEADTTKAETTAPQTQAPVTQAPQTQPPSTAVTNPSGNEILGQGAKTNPFLEIPVIGNGSMSVKTVSIPAGKSLFYSIYRVGGMVVTINSASAYVVCNGTRYDAKNGVVSFVAPTALASDAITFEIGNKSGSAASFTLVFTNLTGTQANPAVLTSVANKITIALSAGDSDGYNYKYKAEKTGKIRFYISATVASVLSVTNNRNSAQRTTEADALTDAQGTYIELDVNAGDELIIVVGAKPDRRGNYPATNITWYAKYV